MVRVHQANDVAAPDLFAEGVAVLRERRGVDDGGADAFHGGDCEWWEHGLELGRPEVVLDQAGYEGAFAGAWRG